jgi:FKBP-type peptidyl-prolyl cis-trans isomerase
MTMAMAGECHYRGLRLNGKEFHSSYARGQTATFPIASTIPGWREALKLMNAASTRNPGIVPTVTKPGPPNDRPKVQRHVSKSVGKALWLEPQLSP